MKKLFVFLAALVGLSVISCNKEANIKVKTVKIKDNKIFADGVVVIPKD